MKKLSKKMSVEIVDKEVDIPDDAKAESSVLGRALAAISGLALSDSFEEQGGRAALNAMHRVRDKIAPAVGVTVPYGYDYRYDPSFTDDAISKIQSFKKSQGLEKTPILAASFSGFVEDGHQGWKNGWPKERFIGLADNSLPVAFHELGHASGLKNKTVRNIVRKSYDLSHGSWGKGLRGVAAGYYAGAEDKPGWVLPAMAATSLPVLGEEARATYHAMKGAVRHKVPLGLMAKDLIPAYGTYAATAAAPILAALLARKVVSVLREEGPTRIDPDKILSEKVAAAIRASGQLRANASAAWNTGAAPKPKSRPPSKGHAKSTPKAAPPGKGAFYKDVLDSLYNPSRGFRAAVGS